MAAKKTNPIGVRFNIELLEELKEKKIADSPQKALSFYEESYRQVPLEKNTDDFKSHEKEKSTLATFQPENTQNSPEQAKNDNSGDMAADIQYRIEKIDEDLKLSFKYLTAKKRKFLEDERKLLIIALKNI